MRPSRFGSLLLVALLATALAGCSSTTVTQPTPPPVLTTDTFTGTLTPSGTNYYTFIAKSGTVAVALTSIGPDPTLKIGMTIGVYSLLTCSTVIDNSAVGVGTQLVGLATATTSMCISVYDPGTIPTGATVTFTATATHY
jgi:hypothetical protein